MKIKILCIAGILIFYTFISTDKGKSQNNMTEIVIKVNASNAKVMNLNEFHHNNFSKINYVPLETITESLIGEIEKIYLYKDYIIVFDNKTNNIFLFNKLGKFIRQIGNHGAGPDDYLMINDIFFEESSELIYVHERLKNVIFMYNLDGKIIDRIKPKFIFNSFCKTVDGFWLYTCFIDNNPKGYNLMLVDNKMQKMLGGYFPQNPNFINVNFISQFRLDSDGNAYFMYPTSNCVYKLNNSIPHVCYRIDFGNKTMPYSEIARMTSRDQYNKLMENDYYKIGEYYVWNNNLFFSFSESSMYKPHPTYSGYYNKNESLLNIFRGYMKSKELPTNTISSTSGKALIYSVLPFELDGEYLEYLEKQMAIKIDEEDNPILIICYP